VSHFNKIPAELVVSVHPSVLGFISREPQNVFQQAGIVVLPYQHGV